MLAQRCHIAVNVIAARHFRKAHVVVRYHGPLKLQATAQKVVCLLDQQNGTARAQRIQQFQLALLIGFQRDSDKHVSLGQQQVALCRVNRNPSTHRLGHDQTDVTSSRAVDFQIEIGRARLSSW